MLSPHSRKPWLSFSVTSNQPVQALNNRPLGTFLLVFGGVDLGSVLFSIIVKYRSFANGWMYALSGVKCHRCEGCQPCCWLLQNAQMRVALAASFHAGIRWFPRPWYFVRWGCKPQRVRTCPTAGNTALYATESSGFWFSNLERPDSLHEFAPLSRCEI